jgi:hypothetical protein
MAKASSKKTAKQSKKRAAIKPVIKNRKVAANSLGKRLLSALDLMQDLFPGSTMWVRNTPPSVSRTPWLLVARYSLPGGTTYEDVFFALYRWRDSRDISRLIGSQRLSRIQVRYTTDRGKEGEYTLAEIGPWDLAVSRAVERVGIRDDKDESLIERYGEGTSKQSDIDALVVWLSAAVSREVVGIPSYHIGGRITEHGTEADERVAENTPVYEHHIGFGRIGIDAPTEDVDIVVPPNKAEKNTWKPGFLKRNAKGEIIEDKPKSGMRRKGTR